MRTLGQFSESGLKILAYFHLQYLVGPPLSSPYHGFIASVVSCTHGYSLSLLSVAVLNTTTNSNVGREGCISYYSSHSTTEGKQGGTQHRKLKAGTEGLSMEKCCLLPRSPWLAQPAFLYNPGPPARAGASHSGRGPLMSIITQETDPLSR